MKKLFTIMLVFVAAGSFAEKLDQAYIGKWIGADRHAQDTETIVTGKDGYIVYEKYVSIMKKRILSAYAANGVLIVAPVTENEPSQLIVVITKDGKLIFGGIVFTKVSDEDTPDADF